MQIYGDLKSPAPLRSIVLVKALRLVRVYIRSQAALDVYAEVSR